jgi:hypothetical protein
VPLNILLPISNKAGDYKTKKVLHVIFQSSFFNKNVDTKFSATARFCNNVHQKSENPII